MLTHSQKLTRMNLDADGSAVRADEYTYLKNGVPVQAHDGHNWAIGSVLGNVEMANADLPAGTNTVIGKLEDDVNNRIIFFICNSLSNHTIYALNSAGTFQRVLRFDFGWTSTSRVDADILGSQLAFTCYGVHGTLKINVTKAIAAATYTPTLEEVSLIKRPPHLVLTGATANDAAYTNNFVYGQYFQFYYRYIYTDNEPSVWSHISQVVRTDVANTTHNYVSVAISGSESIPATVTQIDFAVRVGGSSEMRVYKSIFRSGGSFTLAHNFYNDTFYESVADNEKLKWVDAVPIQTKSVAFCRNRLFLFNNTEGYTYQAAPIANMTFTVGSTGGYGRTHKHNDSYTYGLMFFDNYGRTAGVHLCATSTVAVPDRTNSSTVLRYLVTVNLASVAQADIPTWATHAAIVRTKAKNVSRFIQYHSANIAEADKKTDGTYTWDDGTKDLTYLALDISSLTKLGMGYTFQQGDRLRIWSLVNPGSNLNVIDTPIEFQDGIFVFARNQKGSYGSFFTGEAANSGFPETWDYEIYTPKTDALEIFYETGITIAISSPGTGSRAFSSTSFAIDGDCEVQTRVVYERDGTGFDQTTPEGGELTILAGTFMFTMMNAYDKYYDVWAAEGAWRPMPLSRVGSEQVQKTGVVRFGQLYFQESGVSNLNIFEELDEQPLSVTFGPGTKLQTVGDVLVAIAQNESTAIYVGRGFVETSSANAFLAKTDSVIGDDRKYFGGHGTYHPESVVHFGDVVWFYDMAKGFVIRRSNDGLTRISDYGIANFIHKWSRDNFESRSSYRMYGGYDPVNGLYLLSAVQSNGTCDWTVGFHEKSNSWAGFFDYKPQWYSRLKNFLISFNNGKAWIHNDDNPRMNFYGVQYTRIVEVTVAIARSQVNAWKGLMIDADEFYTGGANSDEVVVITNDGSGEVNSGEGAQRTTITKVELIRRNNQYTSAIYRDLNTPQPFSPSVRAKFEGNPMRGNVIKIRIVANKATTAGRIRGLELLYVPSQLTA